MIIYAEQTRTFYNCKEYDFTISIYCSGVFAFSARHHVTREPITFFSSIDMAFVNAMVGMMKGRQAHKNDPIFQHQEIFVDEAEASETA